jgi:hypothetical protein
MVRQCGTLGGYVHATPVQRKILREKQRETPAGGPTIASTGAARAIGRRTLGSPVRPSPMLIKPAISGVRMGHLRLHGGVAMTFY